MADVIKVGDSLVLCYNDARYFLCYTIKADVQVKLGKESVASNDLIGLPYGTLFSVYGGAPAGAPQQPQQKRGKREPIAKHVQLLKKRPSPSDFMDTSAGADGAQVVEKDNRNLKQDGSAQGLTHAEIEEMKVCCRSLTASAGLDSRVFWWRYSATVSCSPHHVTTKEKKQEKALAAGGSDGASIIRALVENSATWSTKTKFSQEKWLKRKIAKYCPVYQVVPHNSYNIVEALYSRDAGRIQGVRFDSLALILTYSNIYAGCNVLCCDHSGGLIVGSVMERLWGDALVTAVDVRPPAVSILRLFNLPQPVASSLTSLSWTQLLEAPLEEHQYDSVILNLAHDPAQAFHLVIPRLRLGGTLVIFSQYIEALQPLLQWCRSKSGTMIRYSVSEVISRHIQVLPNRTHPNMRMNSRSGFVFVACKVQKEDAVQRDRAPVAADEPPAKRDKKVDE